MHSRAWKKNNSQNYRPRLVSPITSWAPSEPPTLPELHFPSFNLSPIPPSSHSSLRSSQSVKRRSLPRPLSSISTRSRRRSTEYNIRSRHEVKSIDQNLEELQEILQEMKIAIAFEEAVSSQPNSSRPSKEVPSAGSEKDFRDRHMSDMQDLLEELLSMPAFEAMGPSGSGDMSLPPLTNRRSTPSSSWSFDPSIAKIIVADDAYSMKSVHFPLVSQNPGEDFDEGIVLQPDDMFPPPLLKVIPPTPETPTFLDMALARDALQSEDDLYSNHACQGSELDGFPENMDEDWSSHSEDRRAMIKLCRKAWKQLKHKIKSRQKVMESATGSSSTLRANPSDPGHLSRSSSSSTYISRPKPIGSHRKTPPSIPIPDNFAFLPGASSNRRAAIYVSSELRLGSVPSQLSTASDDGIPNPRFSNQFITKPRPDLEDMARFSHRRSGSTATDQDSFGVDIDIVTSPRPSYVDGYLQESNASPTPAWGTFDWSDSPEPLDGGEWDADANPLGWQTHPLIRKHGLALSVVIEEE